MPFSFQLRPDGTLYTCRLLMKTNSIPRWGQAIMPARRVPIIEESIVDADNKTLTTYCRNITHKSIMETTEKVVYTSQEDDSGMTVNQFLFCFVFCFVFLLFFFWGGGWGLGKCD